MSNFIEAGRGATWFEDPVLYLEGIPSIHPNLVTANSNPQYVYFTNGNPFPIAVSTNGGTAFNSLWLPNQNDRPYSLAVDPMNEQTVYVGLSEDCPNYGVYKSINACQSWTLINQGLPASTIVNSIAIANWSSNYILASAGGLIYKLNDQGDTWVQLSTDAVWAEEMVFHPFDDNYVFALSSPFGSDNLIKYSDDGGINWTDLQTGLAGVNVLGGLCVSPTIPTVLYVGTDDGIYRGCCPNRFFYIF